jgi:triphosphatase
MATETEIKLSLSARTAEPAGKTCHVGRHRAHRQLLINTYYDTPDKRLRRERIVVRHRQKGRQCLLTVKTAPGLTGGWRSAASGRFPAGAESSTFRMSITRGRPRPAGIAARRAAARVHDALLAQHLAARAARRACASNSRSTAAGSMRANRRQTIREVELELLAGQVSDLFDRGSELQASLPLHPESSSKSERAYRLLADVPLTAVKALP